MGKYLYWGGEGSQNWHKPFWFNRSNFVETFLFRKSSELFSCLSLEQASGTSLEIKNFPGNKTSISFSGLVKPSELVAFNLWSAGHSGVYGFLLKCLCEAANKNWAISGRLKFIIPVPVPLLQNPQRFANWKHSSFQPPKATTLMINSYMH